jgi:hypothetical protein
MMASVLKYLIAVCVCLVLAGISSIRATAPGFLEGHLKIVSLKEVEVAEETPSKVTTENYANYPLIILSQDGQKEIARATADGNGNYRVALPPGDYVLDVQGRKPKGSPAGGTAAIHGCFKSNRPYRYGYRYRHSVSLLSSWHSQDAIVAPTKTLQRD